MISGFLVVCLFISVSRLFSENIANFPCLLGYMFQRVCVCLCSGCVPQALEGAAGCIYEGEKEGEGRWEKRVSGDQPRPATAALDPL